MKLAAIRPCPTRAAALEPAQAEPKVSRSADAIETSGLEQPDAVVPLDPPAYTPACHLRQPVVGSVSTEVPTPREPGALAHSEEISDPHTQCPAPETAAILEAPRRCSCGCGAPAPVARKTDKRSGAIAGQARRFIKGHAARLRQRLKFTDLTPEKFWPGVQKLKGCWLHRPIQITVAGRRVYAAHVALLLHQGQPVTPETLATIRIRSRCRRHRRCVRPDHAVLLVRCESENMRRAGVIAAARTRMAAWKSTRAS